MTTTNFKQRISTISALTLLTVGLLTIKCVSAGPYFQAEQDPLPSGKSWQKVENMSDEFDGSTLNPNKWQADPVGNGWSWIGRAPGLFDKQAISVANGNLRVTVSQLPAPKTVNGKEFLYQGAIVRSIHPGQHGWYYEAKMKANKTEMSSTFWLMSKNSNCHTKHELDIQENVGIISPLVHSWATEWDHIFHSNAIHRKTSCQPEPNSRDENLTLLTEKNWQRYFVYGAWWKSPTEILFYLDGKYQYTLTPTTDFNVAMWLQMAIETYDWNPVPSDGGHVKKGTWDERTTQYQWVRTWQVSDAPAASDTN
ncbi:MAG: glycosyl hydrolase [Thalassotalea sp.]